MTRSGCIDILYEHVKDRTPLSRQQYEDSLMWWEIEPILVNGELAGAVMLSLNRIHIVVKPEFHGTWMKKSYLKFLRERVQQHGPLQAEVFKTNDKAIELVERLGFKRTNENDSTDTYTLD